MSDLISRSAVIDVLKETGIIQDNDLGHLVVEEINRITTAYDVEKVVAEIRRCSGNGYRDIDGDYVPPMIETKDAIDIVKRGGVDERT